jgi:putative FmdB family regulatory protein
MPTYAYKCAACGHSADEWLKMSEATAERSCPTCGKIEYRKQVSAPAFQLKGGGWYVTDFRDNKAKSGAAESPSPAESGSAVAAKTAETPSPAAPAASSTTAPTPGSTAAE